MNDSRRDIFLLLRHHSLTSGYNSYNPKIPRHVPALESKFLNSSPAQIEIV